MNRVAFIIPSHNNLRHLKNVYESITKNAPSAKILFLDDASTDGTYEWLLSLPQTNLYPPFRSQERVGHTILYDKGISLVEEEVVGILHADMLVGPNYVENILQHLKPGRVVCGTRVEPPLHPPGKEKIIQNFGLDFDSLDVQAFEQFCLTEQRLNAGHTTRGMFAPWMIHKADFNAIGGHDPVFAPFPYEDSDIFQRWILAGYELIQSRDAFVYHLTCRGHRWNEGIGKEDDYFKIASNKAARNYIRKWGSWIQNDEYQYPIIPPKYNIHASIENCSLPVLALLEPWFDCCYIEQSMIEQYIKLEQEATLYDLTQRVKPLTKLPPVADIFIEFDATKLTQSSIAIIQQLAAILQDSGEVGEFDLDIFKVKITQLKTYEQELVNISNKGRRTIY